MFYNIASAMLYNFTSIGFYHIMPRKTMPTSEHRSNFSGSCGFSFGCNRFRFPNTFAIFIILGFSVVTAFNSQPVHGQVSQSSGDFDIAAVGDWGCTSYTNQTASNISIKNPALILGLGDYSYEDTNDCWFKQAAPLLQK